MGRGETCRTDQALEDDGVWGLVVGGWLRVGHGGRGCHRSWWFFWSKKLGLFRSAGSNRWPGPGGGKWWFGPRLPCLLLKHGGHFKSIEFNQFQHCGNEAKKNASFVMHWPSRPRQRMLSRLRKDRNKPRVHPYHTMPYHTTM